MNTILLNTISDGKVVIKRGEGGGNSGGGNSGGGAVSVSPKAVNFRDYDGTVLHAYSKEEFLALNELPPLPTREGLICQEWNYDFADAVEYVTEYGVLEVGATYITDDGKTRLYITIAAEGRMDVPLYFNQSVANGVTIDWGDGSATETISGTGNKNATHHYNAIGDYCISLEVADGCTLGLGHNSSSYCVMGSVSNESLYNCTRLKRAEIGKDTKVNDSAFYKCYCLAAISLPREIIELGGNVFRNCYELPFVVIPKNVTNSSSYMVANCTTLSSISLPKVVSINGSVFDSCYSLSSIVIPNSVTSILGYSFRYCYSLSSIVIPNSVTSIEAAAFANCSGIAFFDFSALTSIPSLKSSNAFNNTSATFKIIVSDALFDEWIAATNWSTYASYIIKKSEWDSLNA